MPDKKEDFVLFMPNHQQIDQLAYYDPLVKKDSLKMSEPWIASLSSHIDTLNNYLTPYGIIIPNITTAERATIQSPVNGQLIYNLTVDAPQFYQISSGSWRTISFT
jgi:hypothetical protein